MKGKIMRNILIVVTAALIGGVVCAAPGKPAMSKLGGMLQDKDSFKGVIVFFNAQQKVPVSEIETVIATITENMRFNIIVKTVDPLKGLPTAEAVKAGGANVGIFFGDLPDYPALLAAPEENWSFVNVAKLQQGLNDDILGKKMLNTRARGELMRGFGYACGIGESMYEGNLFGITKTADLDSVKPDTLVFDMAQRCTKHLNKIGVTELKMVTYHHACKAGWAPPPTNDIQKSVWDKVHQLPTKPIKIEYNEKRDKGK